jgi:hypothetical protein
MISVEGSARVRASSEEVVKFVLDLNNYRRADTKIGTVLVPAELGSDDNGRVRYRGRIVRFPTRAVWNSVHLDRWHHLEFRSERSGRADLFLASFVGTFDCDQDDDGCVVRHRESFTLRRAWAWILEPALRAWLRRQMVDEMDRLSTLVEKPMPQQCGGGTQI